MSTITNEVNNENKKKRIVHSSEFQAETLKLTEKVRVATTARQLSLHESQIYAWRKAAKKNTTTSQRELELTAEVAKLKGRWKNKQKS